MRRAIGFLLNPIAGMGGTVGLAGTDGVVAEALRRGAAPRSAGRAVQVLSLLKDDDITWCTCSAPMGEDALIDAGIDRSTVLYRPAVSTGAADTKAACRAFLEAGVDLVAFCGGDGTARDVFDAVGREVPVLGIPAGVKMYSAVFAVDPPAAVTLIRETGRAPCRDSEVMDIDEGAYRSGRLAARLYGYARVPYLPERIQSGKQVFEQQDEERAKDDIAAFINEVMLPDTLYIIGAGSTTARIMERLGLAPTLLGVDAVRGGEVVARNADEKTLLSLLDRYPRAKIVASPIGAQGFVLGRGNQQISPAVIRKAGLRNLIVVATPGKLAATPLLYVDSGDAALDREVGDSFLVVSGYRMAQRKRVVHPM
ncbi:MULTISPECIES: ATP-NAD kinase family protein [unclassified Methanoculleus]|jgi:predicted polyphosphate/ATP-dependent NAD kinase|uniref:ATP-NAD kinase family protein n=1 Tax=Methanoculleus palmolei TaxID=72612 RepID=A0ABD8AAE1_9EURY|nr:ATP-NAD kinase family protein [Methanoculleus sp. UBA377]WOX56493.1 ATP-NAD kinase family protein [Methanoculleus palmolei]